MTTKKAKAKAKAKAEATAKAEAEAEATATAEATAKIRATTTAMVATQGNGQCDVQGRGIFLLGLSYFVALRAFLRAALRAWRLTSSSENMVPRQCGALQ